MLLPGLDGTGLLFEPFLSVRPAWARTEVIALPQERPHSYTELDSYVMTRLPKEPFWLLGESFSGPLAIALAAATRVRGLILCATFATSPIPRWLPTPPRFLLEQSPPEWALRRFLTGGDAGLAKTVREALASVPPEVVAARVHAVLHVDARPALARVRAPTLVLHANHDRLVPARCTHSIASCMKDAHIARIDAPHLLLQTAPRQAWHAISRFVGAAPEPT